AGAAPCHGRRVTGASSRSENHVERLVVHFEIISSDRNRIIERDVAPVGNGEELVGDLGPHEMYELGELVVIARILLYPPPEFGKDRGNLVQRRPPLETRSS